MRDYLPIGQGRQIIQETDFATPIRTRPGPLNRKGDARSQKLKVVCARCNAGWMSALQEQTKPILLPLILREPKTLDEKEQRALAVWITMFSLVYETCFPEYAASTTEQKIAFKIEQEPPQNWTFWCASFDGKFSPVVTSSFGSKNRKPIVYADARKVNKASLHTFGVGAVSLAILSVNSSEAHQAFSQFVTMIIEGAGFIRLWPAIGRVIQITDGRLSPLTYRDFGAIRDVIRDSLAVAVRRGS